MPHRFGPHFADASDFATLFVNYAACQISDKNAWGVMLRNDVIAGYQGKYGIIKTYKTFKIEQLWKNFDFQFDVIIEDGLHTFNANKIFFENSINILKDGGIFIIEDIDKRYHSDFNNFINQVKNRYKFIDLVKIPNSRNDGDNNIILVIK